MLRWHLSSFQSWGSGTLGKVWSSGPLDFHEKVRASISWSIALSEIFLLFLVSRFSIIVVKCAAQLPIHILNFCTEFSRSARVLFIAGGVIESNLVHRRTVAVLCMLFSSLMHLRSGELPLPYMPARVTCAWVDHNGARLRFLCCRTSLPQDLHASSISLWLDLNDSVFDGVELASFNNRANLLFLLVFHNFLVFFLAKDGCVGFWVFGLIEHCNSLPALRCRLFY